MAKAAYHWRGLSPVTRARPPMSDHDPDDLSPHDPARPQRGARPIAPALVGAFSAGITLIVILLFLAY